MDRIKDSGSFGPGSNPGGVTKQQTKKNQAFVFSKKICRLIFSFVVLFPFIIFYPKS